LNFAWNYRTREIVTNKSGTGFGGKCSTLAEGEHNIENEIVSHGLGTLQYETNQLMNCKYIDFSEY
jgi:hypothetical protein